MILILVDQITNRVTYTFDFIFKERDMPYKLTQSVTEFEGADEMRKLNYSSQSAGQIKRIKPSLFLRETVVTPTNIQKAKFEQKDCLSFDDQSDIVASVFYVLTRYEEYLSAKDEHDRFSFNSSILKEFDWIETAVCDRWARAIIEFLDPDLYIDVTLSSALAGSKSKFVPTFDIDNTYAFKYKKGKRKILSAARDLLKFDFERMKERKEVNSGNSDPYDTFDRIEEIAKSFSETKIFWLVESNGEKDRNLELSIQEHRQLIQRMSKSALVNLHPSYASYIDGVSIGMQKGKLEQVTGTTINATRQHFLRFKLPQTFQALSSIGIEHDYSLGFPERAGFRCGTARPHLWFDLSKNQVTTLTVHPFVYMDGTLHEYMKLTIAESKSLVQKLYEEVKEYGGDFIFIWHNETIGNYKKWKGWSEVLDYTLKLKK